MLPSGQGFSQGSGHTNLDNAINDPIVFRTKLGCIFMIDMVGEYLLPLEAPPLDGDLLGRGDWETG